MSIGSAGYVKRRSPTVAGIFYPEEPKDAEEALKAFESGRDRASAPNGNAAIALIAPHAGWDLSGQVIADAFAAASGRTISTVALIGPLHEDSAEGLFLSESEYFETPIGDIPVDRGLSEELESCGTFFIVNDIPHLEEHSIEILLPFVRRSFPSAAIVPILIGGKRTQLVRMLARGLDLVFGPIADSTLFVVSTNMCANLAAKTANEHADLFSSCVTEGNSAQMIEGLSRGTLSACGAAGCAALLDTRLLDGRKAVTLSTADSSGRPEHDPRKLVRYASFAFF